MIEDLAVKVVYAMMRAVHEDDPECDVSDEGLVSEYAEQLAEGSHNEYMRMWLGYKIEEGSGSAIEAMKELIRYNLGAAVW